MQSAKTIGTLGIIVAVLPYIGIPGAWYRPLVFMFGFGIAFLALRVFFVRAESADTKTMRLPFEKTHVVNTESDIHA